MTRSQKWIAICLLIGISGLLICGYFAWRFEYRVQAWIWHRKHGDHVTVAGFKVPVPTNWWAAPLGTGSVNLLNSEGQAILLDTALLPLDGAQLDRISEVLKREPPLLGTSFLGERELTVDGTRFHCFEKDFQVSVPVAAPTKSLELHNASVECWSAGRLNVVFIDSNRATRRTDFSEFYAWMNTIRKGNE